MTKTKKILIGLTAGTVIATGIMLTNRPDPNKAPLPFQDKEIHILYTDDNRNEDLIIYSDRENYGGSDSVWFSVENQGDDQNVLLAGLFSNDDITYDIQELKPQKEFVENYYVCEGKQTTINVGKQDEETKCDEPLTEKSRTIKKDIAEKLPTQATDIGYAFNEKKPHTHDRKGQFRTHIKSGETKYFVMNINSPIKLEKSVFGDKEEFFIEARGDKGAYGHLDPWLDNNWDHRVSVTVDADQVDANLTDFPVYVDLSDLPAGFHSNVKSDGGDIRVTTSDETTEVPREVVWYDAGTDTGELHLKGDVSSTTDTVFYIYYGNAAASEPAASATYGSQNVWTDYAAVYHMQDSSTSIADSTSGGNTMTDDGGGTTYSVTGQIGNAIDFSGGVFSIASALVSAYPFTFQAWSEPDSDNANITLLSVGDTDANESATIRHALGADTVAQSRTVSGGFDMASAGGVTVSNTWQLVHGVFSGDSARAVLHNGGSKATDTGTAAISGWDLTMVGARANGTGELQMNGAIDEVRIRTDAPADTWIASEYTNHNSPLTFYTVGTQEDAPAEAGTEGVRVYILGGDVSI